MFQSLSYAIWKKEKNKPKHSRTPVHVWINMPLRDTSEVMETLGAEMAGASGIKQAR